MFSLRSLALAALVAFGVVLVTPAEAQAQGTCRCNMGCHANPGMCVQNSANNCAAGYAPYCSNRASTCPMAGWISCSGDCTCVHIPGYDAGTPSDGSVPMDVPTPPPDGPVSMDRPIPPGDGPVSMDTPVPPGDGPVSMDGPAPPMDASVPCPDGVVVDGVCYSERCQYQMEIGWVCTTRGRTCRIVGDVPYCVPTCADAMCTAGSYCDPIQGCVGTDGGRGPNCDTIMCPQGEVCDPAMGCVSDRCPSMTCPSGQVCRANACVPAGSGDGGLGDGATNGDGGHNGGRGGCGCRTVTATGPRGDGAALLALGLAGLAAAALRRRRHARALSRDAR